MRKGLLISTMLVSVAGLEMSANVWAQCATTTCSSLGYTSSSNTGDCLKCPFGEAWACPKITCPDNAKYTCSGTNITGGVGIPCNGKYTECACASGYEWENGNCIQASIWGQCTGLAASCTIGDILFSDGTCSTNTVSGKTPIGIVIYISDEGCGQALALKSIGNYEWGRSGTDISSLPNHTRVTAVLDLDSCSNTAKIIAAGDKSKYPAAWAANEYKTEGTSAGDWCLPAAGIFTSYYDNQTAVNIGFERVNGTKFTTSTHAWSSSELDKNWAWYSDFSNAYGLSSHYKYSYFFEVRPVIEF